MKLVNLFLIIVIIFADFAICSIDALQNELDQNSNSNEVDQVHEVDRFTVFRPRKHTRRLTCNRLPRICRAKGSPGPTCCKKKCVNVMRDRHNCGKCGKKCKYNKICCNGKCINPSFHKRHCGGCNNRCKNGGLCAFGLCSYS
ncbi:hypothetical protein TIFTF001_042460 [Ficus carica]|uniref:Stigma-specific STIG1-like protein 1 n=1 Tax=Ficus carica TaxID=3494 RepID=A0AA88CZE4_FICCA|nr:hypothetical protein TIFTF001_042452 [Ficus carica]GMN36523.1 hypothetical protein TIFTF001_042454 [Ficus carica]GMN36536.1 hypothetical protein TIFTF001_042458 [Ficus carica]GMN36553.1 hypothetical protein TIFTF001_042460 [Ficus carica]